MVPLSCGCAIAVGRGSTPDAVHSVFRDDAVMWPQFTIYRRRNSAPDLKCGDSYAPAATSLIPTVRYLGAAVPLAGVIVPLAGTNCALWGMAIAISGSGGGLG
jgi:hypothetical protein